MSERIGFIGLGIMGLPMAEHIVSSGYPLTAYDLNPSRLSPLLEAGATAAKSPSEVASMSDITITMVPDSSDVEAAICGPEGVINGAVEGSAVIDMSTISPNTSRSLAARLSKRGVDMLDAPVTGGQWGAEEASLSIMVGGDKATFERCLPVLQVLGGLVTHMGSTGAGHTAKLANQILSAGCLSGVNEALLFASKSGLDLRVFLEAALKGAGRSWHLETMGPRIIEGNFAPGFLVRHMQKDLRLVQEAAAEMALPLPMSDQQVQLYRSVEAAGGSEMGHHALIKALETLSGIEARV